MKKTETNICRNLINEESKQISLYDNEELFEEKSKLLLHSCCGPCSTSVVEDLAADYDITIFFYNPNITDIKEYGKRKEAQVEFVQKYNESLTRKAQITFTEGKYNVDDFIKLAEPFAHEEEGGRRCEDCFKMRLEETALTAKMAGFEYFSSTLSVSPHKEYEVITNIGKRIGVTYGLTFLDNNFKKQDGYKRSIELAKNYNLYRQNYCGCKYSK
ncbi:MAG: epoxyqueuosine reductase QueH [Anaerovoracaceae bacterium]